MAFEFVQVLLFLFVVPLLSFLVVLEAATLFIFLIFERRSSILAEFVFGDDNVVRSNSEELSLLDNIAVMPLDPGDGVEIRGIAVGPFAVDKVNTGPAPKLGVGAIHLKLFLFGIKATSSFFWMLYTLHVFAEDCACFTLFVVACSPTE